MKVRFAKVNPVENMTIFVLDNISRDKHLSIANRLMNYNSLYAEQVGFIEEPKSIKAKSLNTHRLQMMGGEFCGNATRSLAAYMVYDSHPAINKIAEDEYIVTLEVSGSEELLNCNVKKTENESILNSRISMPLPERINKIKINKIPATRVDFEGISHFIVDSHDIDDKEDFYRTVKRYMENEDYDAFGIMYYDKKKELMEPLVYVRMTNSRFWERSCASGTSAYGIAMAVEKKENISLKVDQPGGFLEVEVKLEAGKVKEVFLNGSVEIVAEGTVNL